MTQESEALLQLSKEDQIIQQSARKLEKIPQERNLIRKPLHSVETYLTELSKKVEKIQRQITLRERLIAIEKKKLDRSNKRMMTVSNQKEFSAMQKEVDETTRILRRTEDQILDLEEKALPLQAEITQANKELADKTKDLQGDLDELDGREKELQTRSTQAQAQREKLLTQVPQKLLGAYQALVARKIVPAAIEVSTASCYGCAMAIRPQVFNDIMRAGSGVCPTCRRLIFYKAPESKEEKEEPKAKQKKAVST